MASRLSFSSHFLIPDDNHALGLGQSYQPQSSENICIVSMADAYFSAPFKTCRVNK